MINLIERFIRLENLYQVEGSFSIFRDDTDLYIMLRLTKNRYRIIKCITYKQWLEFTNLQQDFVLSDMIQELIERIAQDEE